MSDKPCFIIAEIGVNHNGEKELAKKLIEVAADCGASAAKFQTFKAEDLVVEATEAVAYQKEGNANVDQFNLLKSLELSIKDHEELVRHCNQCGIEFMSTGFDEKSLASLVQLGIKRVKIASGEVTNTPLVEASAKTLLPIVLSTGMATLEEVEECVSTIQAVWDDQEHVGELVVLHCTSAYPTALNEVNLASMQTIRDKLNVTVGYSDHTVGTRVASLAVAAGATVIEKHITLDRTMVGPDHSASIEPDELKQMVDDIRLAEIIRGSATKEPQSGEMEARKLVRKGLKYKKSFAKGHLISRQDLVTLRPETGLRPSKLSSLIGSKLKHDVTALSPVEEEDLEVY